MSFVMSEVRIMGEAAGLSSNIFETKCEAIVIPTNCVGTNGAGLAKAAADLFAGWDKEYRSFCRRTPPKPGQVITFGEGRPRIEWPVPYLLALTTKDHYRDPSRIAWVEAGLQDLERTIVMCNLKSVAIPALGCGAKTGQLDWDAVRPLIMASGARLAARGVLVEVYPPAPQLDSAATKLKGLDDAVKTARSAFKKANVASEAAAIDHANHPTLVNKGKLKASVDAREVARSAWIAAEQAANEFRTAHPTSSKGRRDR